MYIETSSPRKPKERAQFLSPFYPAAPNGKCLNFWYHMFGSHIGAMNVYIKDGLSIGTKVWNETGNQGNFWLHARAPIKINNRFQVRCLIHAVVSYMCCSACSRAICYWFQYILIFLKIVIEGITGQSYQGDIAIDDLWIDDSPCPPEGHFTFYFFIIIFQAYSQKI